MLIKESKGGSRSSHLLARSSAYNTLFPNYNLTKREQRATMLIVTFLVFHMSWLNCRLSRIAVHKHLTLSTIVAADFFSLRSEFHGHTCSGQSTSAWAITLIQTHWKRALRLRLFLHPALATRYGAIYLSPRDRYSERTSVVCLSPIQFDGVTAGIIQATQSMPPSHSTYLGAIFLTSAVLN